MFSVGDNVMDRYLATGTMFPGGGAVNVTVHARRSGAAAGYLGTVGDDVEGTLVLDALRAEGVDVSRVRTQSQATAITDISINEWGERTFVAHHPGVAVSLDDDDLRHLAGSDWLYTNYSSDSEHLVPALAGIAPLAFDFSYKDDEYAAPLLRHVTLAAFSRSGLDIDDCLDLISRTHAAGPRYVVVTRGADGALVGADGAVLHQPAEPVTAVDTLGAGDAFLARFACGVFGGTSAADAAASASIEAARVCTHHGGFGYAHPIDHERQGQS
jgi:fructoselysine 6-kinase